MVVGVGRGRATGWGGVQVLEAQPTVRPYAARGMVELLRPTHEVRARVWGEGGGLEEWEAMWCRGHVQLEPSMRRGRG